MHGVRMIRMTRLLLFLTFASVCAVGQIGAEQAVRLTPQQAAKVLARVAMPELPREAIRTGRTGREFSILDLTMRRESFSRFIAQNRLAMDY